MRTTFPAWTHTVGAMLEARTEKPEDCMVRVSCTVCHRWRAVNLAAIVERKGAGYSLINKWFRCRLTNGCGGWNRFFYQSGVMRGLWDNEITDRWPERPPAPHSFV